MPRIWSPPYRAGPDAPLEVRTAVEYLTPSTLAYVIVDGVVVTTPRLNLSTAEDVATLEAELGLSMPPGYEHFVTTYGEGTFCDMLQICSPARVRRLLAEFRERWAEFWFWDGLITQAEMADAVVVADTDAGDEFVLHPGHEQLMCLPRDDERVYPVGSTLTELIDWYCTSGVLIRPERVRSFESWIERRYENWSGGNFEDVRTAVAALGIHEVEDLDAEERSATFHIPAIGGHVSVRRPESPTYVHMQYDAQLAEVVEPVVAALLEAGAGNRSRWGAGLP